MKSFSAILIFVNAAELGSFSRVALAMNIEKSTVSRSVAALERELRVKLFRRTARNLVLTEAGHIFLESAKKILAELNETQRALTTQSDEVTGTLRVNAPTEFGRVYMGGCMSRLLTEEPTLSIELNLSDDSPEELSHTNDVVIHIGEPPDARLFAKRLARDRYVICAGPTYLAKAGAPQNPYELERHSCIGADRSNVWMFKGHSSTVVTSVAVSGRFSSNNLGVLLEAAVRDSGLVCLPLWLASSSLREGRLHTVLDTYEVVTPVSDIHAIYPESRAVSPKLRLFLAFLSRDFESAPDWVPPIAAKRSD
jgi:DNA-binding transcriptional LysR family regulator|tara:strand:- start:159 stop:1088 length:930 start_codon:yes stop_codon:yes gene_type:complete